MNILRRSGILAAVGAIASTLAFSAPIISYGTDPSTGLHTVTQTVTFPSQALPAQAPAALATFANFASLGIAANYVAGDTTMDYQFSNHITQFQVTNNDTQTDSVNFGLNSIVTPDPGTNLSATDTHGVCQNIGNAGATFVLPANCTNTFAIVNQMNVSINGGATFTLGGLPINDTLGVCVFNGGTFGTVNATGGGKCAETLTNDAVYAGGGSNSFGIQDAGSYFFSAASMSSNANLTFNSTVTFTGTAEITYEYVIPSGTPEPATMVLFGSALVGLGLLRKRVRQ